MCTIGKVRLVPVPTEDNRGDVCTAGTCNSMDLLSVWCLHVGLLLCSPGSGGLGACSLWFPPH